MLRQLRFLICCFGTLLLYKITNGGWLFYAAGFNAFANLFSGQFECATNSCDIKIRRRPIEDPVFMLHAATTVAGGLFTLYGVVVV